MAEDSQARAGIALVCWICGIVSKDGQRIRGQGEAGYERRTTKP